MSHKKHKLSVSIDEDYSLLGIVSDIPDYKLCWQINHQLQYSFAKTDDLVLFNKKLNQDMFFSVFQYDDERSMISYRLIGNRTETGYFITELKNIDYLLHMQGELVPDDIHVVISRFLAVKSVRMCVPVELNKIKDKERLQLW